jgi:hypothetical protein
MATVVRAWRINDGKLDEIPELPPNEQGLVEQRLEDWLESQPDAIQDNLLIIGRQVSTGSGPLDLLGLTVDGQAVVIELKRDRAPRETVAQVIDYASWVAAQEPDHVRSIATTYLKKPLDDAFQEKFGQRLPELQLVTPSILVVASRLDASTERMIRYLSNQYGMDIDGLVFRYVRLPDGQQILIRTSVVSEAGRTIASESYQVSADSLMQLGLERKSIPTLNTLRHLSDFLWEEAVRTYGGSFRYWGGRMLCGVNVAGNWGAPLGTTDVWVSHGSWAQMTGLPEESLMNELKSRFEFVKQYEGSHQMIVRVKSEEKAEELVSLLRGWFQGQPQTRPPAEETANLLETTKEGD